MRPMIGRGGLLACMVLLGAPTTALAGPPYVSDDPEPTDTGHYEIYFFTNGSTARAGSTGAAGVDFNYGGARDLQLTASIPLDYTRPRGGGGAAGFGNVELAAKYRFLHQAEIGVDIAVFPRIFLPSGSSAVGENHASFLLPLWLEKDWDRWSSFGGGGCELNRGGGAQDFCLMGWAVTHQFRPDLQMGIELVHQTPDTKGGRASTALGIGLSYAVSETWHLLAYAGPGLQNRAETARYSWYASVLATF
jgi:hypothetical protein